MLSREHDHFHGTFSPLISNYPGPIRSSVDFLRNIASDAPDPTCNTGTMTATRKLDFTRVWQAAVPYAEFVAGAQTNRSLWEGMYRTTPIPAWALKRACECGTGLRLIAIVEDWCGDASNTVPVLAKLGDVAECLEMRLIERDENPEVMDRYLTNGARSIPIVIVLDADLKELGHWGPRPAELQHWVMAYKDSMSKEERYRHIRRWYAKDKGVSILSELLELIESATKP